MRHDHDSAINTFPSRIFQNGVLRLRAWTLFSNTFAFIKGKIDFAPSCLLTRKRPSHFQSFLLTFWLSYLTRLFAVQRRPSFANKIYFIFGLLYATLELLTFILTFFQVDLTREAITSLKVE